MKYEANKYGLPYRFRFLVQGEDGSYVAAFQNEDDAKAFVAQNAGVEGKENGK